MADSLPTRIRLRARRERHLAQKRAFRLGHPFPREGRKAVVLVVGCQRSGTTLMLELFDADRRSVTFPEKSRLSSAAEDRLRLKPLPEVKRQLERVRAPLLVLKPLVESQYVPTWLEGLDNSYAIWMYRRAENVAASDLSHFGVGNGERNLASSAVERAAQLARRGRSGDDPVDPVASLPAGDGSSRCGGALLVGPDVPFFRPTARQASGCSSLFVRTAGQRPGASDAVALRVRRRGVSRAGHHRGVHRGSAGRKDEFQLSPDVRRLCEELWDRLESVDSGRGETFW